MKLKAKDARPFFSKDYEISSLHVPGIVRKQENLDTSFPTKHQVKAHLLELGFPSPAIDTALKEYSNVSQVDVSTAISQILERGIYPEFPNTYRYYYYIVQHNTFILRKQASREILNVRESELEGIVTTMQIFTRPRCVHNFKQNMNTTLLLSFLLPPIISCSLMGSLTFFVPPEIIIEHPYLIATAGTILCTPVLFHSALFSDSYFNYKSFKPKLQEKMQFIANLAESPSGLRRRFFGFVTDMTEFVKLNKVPYKSLKEKNSDEMFVSYASIFTTEPYRNNVTEPWKAIYAQRKDGTISFILLLYLSFLFLALLFIERQEMYQGTTILTSISEYFCEQKNEDEDSA